MKVKDLEEMVSKATGIPVSELLLLLRHEPTGYGQLPRVELMNMDWARTKLIKDLRSRFDHGTMLLVEQGSLKTVKFENMNWHKSISANDNILKVFVGY